MKDDQFDELMSMLRFAIVAVCLTYALCHLFQ